MLSENYVQVIKGFQINLQKTKLSDKAENIQCERNQVKRLNIILHVESNSIFIETNLDLV